SASGELVKFRKHWPALCVSTVSFQGKELKQTGEKHEGHMASRHDRMTIHQWDGVTVLDLGDMDIWDGADLSLLRDTLTELIQEDGCRDIGVRMHQVKYVPSGFFGML